MRISAQSDNHSSRKRVTSAKNGHFLVLQILLKIATQRDFQLKSVDAVKLVYKPQLFQLETTCGHWYHPQKPKSTGLQGFSAPK